MKMSVLFALVVFISIPAQADYGAITCDNGTQLLLDETSDVTVETTSLKINRRSVRIEDLVVKQSDYGILEMTVRVARGSKTTEYTFKNLGSSKCFGVYESRQRGSAYVTTEGAEKSMCECSQD